MIYIFLGFIFYVFFMCLVIFSYFSSFSRFSVFLNKIISFMTSLLSPNVGNLFIVSLFFMLVYMNLIGNFPMTYVPTIFYSFSFSVSLTFWVSLIVCVGFTQLKTFLSHILPYGSPFGLILFLPLVEIFSHMIRPLTLMIRLGTNLSAGHIIIYMFSYFTLLSSILAPFIYIVIFLLLILEFFISILQAYIFVSLVSLYLNETC